MNSGGETEQRSIFLDRQTDNICHIYGVDRSNIKQSSKNKRVRVCVCECMRCVCVCVFDCTTPVLRGADDALSSAV